ncbi:MAG: hypothetical protein DWQ34_11170 [Planctomycetota bacterium]|nr:MAG: hypothetical protein DWQ34_11170 [Planctomycetota bacterium]REK29721.1 MAG: hypothetical protein DWQ41_03530 [Planctomycetota bacterium]REK30458.1 MAG: hypothetical protein DWQ45_21505 [Planctomycetota bacterium]
MAPAGRNRSKRTVCLWALGAFLLTVHYVLSYAPAYRVMRDWNGDLLPWGGYWWVYRPVDVLIDETPLQRPLMAWADVCGVRDEFDFAMFVRSSRSWDAENYTLERQLILGEDGYEDRIQEIRDEISLDEP